MAFCICKSCGGNLQVEENVTVGTCEFCGTTQTLPLANDDKKMTLFVRANRLRFSCEFDKASGVYESIVAEFPEEAEAYWGLILCKFGIEYVDDPKTGKKIPTCHRTSFENVLDDPDFALVMENATPMSKKLYREEAKRLEELRRDIVETSSKEDPYDIFICYKETDAEGERTLDSLIAQDVYDALTERGYRVFFSRVTLEDKLGQMYEPYIFSALQSAKIMLAFGTDYEHYNAVWVRNEWSRFLQLIEKGEKKTLIPCYKNIDAYDIPKEFTKLQAQDMGKVGAMQDLLRGIEKILPHKDAVATHHHEEAPAHSEGNAQVESFLKLAGIFLGNRDWSNADTYYEAALTVDPANAQANLGKLLVALQITELSAMKDLNESPEHLVTYQNAYRYANEAVRRELKDAVALIHEKAAAEEKRCREVYAEATALLAKNYSARNCKRAAGMLKSIAGYEDADAIAAECRRTVRRSVGDFFLYLIVAVLPVLCGIFIHASAALFGCVGFAVLFAVKLHRQASRGKRISNGKKRFLTICSILTLAYAIVHPFVYFMTAEKSYAMAAFAVSVLLVVACCIELLVLLGKGRGYRILRPVLALFGSLCVVVMALWCFYSPWQVTLLPDGTCAIIGVRTDIEGEVEIPSRYLFFPVTQIREGALEGQENVHELTVPDSVTTIERGALAGCNKLELLSVPFIGSEAEPYLGYFWGAEDATENAEYVPEALTAVTVTGSRAIGEYAFLHCANLKQILFAESCTLTEIGARAFEKCRGLSVIYLPETTETVGDGAFWGCTNIVGVHMPDSVTHIGDSAFYNCSSLTSVTIPDSVTSIGDYAFSYCSLLTSITIPDSVTSIGSSAFADCSSLTSITIPDSVTSIGDGAFYYCPSLTSVTIPDSVTSIGSQAFSGCSSLKSITIPDSVTSIGSQAFSGCSLLATVYYDGTEREWNGISVGSNNVALLNGVCYYSETRPTESGNYWHYVNGVPTKW